MARGEPTAAAAAAKSIFTLWALFECEKFATLARSSGLGAGFEEFTKIGSRCSVLSSFAVLGY